MPGLTVHVFGKEGCQKCAMLKKRLGTLLETEEYSMFSMVYHDVMTLDGIVDFCKTECLNPNRIPAMLVAGEDGKYIRSQYNKDRARGVEVFAPSVTYLWLGIQTDYDGGGGLITPPMIKDVLDKAKALA